MQPFPVHGHYLPSNPYIPRQSLMHTEHPYNAILPVETSSNQPTPEGSFLGSARVGSQGKGTESSRRQRKKEKPKLADFPAIVEVLQSTKRAFAADLLNTCPLPTLDEKQQYVQGAYIWAVQALEKHDGMVFFSWYQILTFIN
jgi:hypothetical protein